jgi:CRP-like cAMP-binding protein
MQTAPAQAADPPGSRQARRDMPLSVSPTIENRVLSALPKAELDRLRPHLQPVALRQKQILHAAGAAIEQVYFVEQGLASVLTVMADGGAVEVRMVGREGVSDVSYALGAELSSQQVIVQVPGSALRISAALLRAEFETNEALRHGLLRCAATAMTMTSQSAACNRLHSLEQRCARWLLNASDRIGSATMPMTHEFLSSLLGVRRSGVTATANRLRRIGLIHYRRGRLTIINRAAMEACACECYQADREQLASEEHQDRRTSKINKN